MALKIVWTPEAEETFDEIILYLEGNFGDSSVSKFIRRVQEVLDEIAEYPLMFQASIRLEVRKGFISRQTSLYYRVHEDTIELLSFWNNRKNSKDRIW